MNLILFGVSLGTCDGYDQQDTQSFTFYDAKLNERFAELFGGDSFDYLNVDMENGVIVAGSNDSGDLTTMKNTGLQLECYDK